MRVHSSDCARTVKVATNKFGPADDYASEMRVYIETGCSELAEIALAGLQVDRRLRLPEVFRSLVHSDVNA